MVKIKQIIWNSIVFIGLGSNYSYSSFDQEQAGAIFSRETLSLLQKKLVEINSHTYNTHRDKSRVLVLGPTGSGKSTLVTYLAGIPLKVGQELSGQKKLIAEAQLPGIEIGDGTLAQTKVPAAWVDERNDIVYWDCPGFLDTEGPTQEIGNTVMIHKIVYNEEKRISDPVKILFVVPYEYITSAVENEDDTRFTGQLSRVTGMFPDELLGPSLYLVITQAKPELSIKKKLLQLLDNLLKKENPLKERVLSIARSLKIRVMNDLFYNFPKPSSTSAVGSDYISDRVAIDKVLYSDYSRLRVALNLGPEASDYIGRLCAACQDYLISQFRRQGPEIIKNHFTQKMQREEYDEVRGQIERLRTLETAVQAMNSFKIAEKLEEFVGLPVRLEIEKTLHVLEALRTLEGFQGVYVEGLMKNLLKEVSPEVLRTVAKQLISNIGKYVATQGIESIRGLESKQLLNWYQRLDEVALGIDIVLERFREIDSTENIEKYIAMKQYLKGVDGAISFVDREIIDMIRNAHAPYIVAAQAKVISEYESKIQEQAAKTRNLINSMTISLERVTGKDVILVFGTPGVGKSTVINYLLGYELEGIKRSPFSEYHLDIISKDSSIVLPTCKFYLQERDLLPTLYGLEHQKSFPEVKFPYLLCEYSIDTLSSSSPLLMEEEIYSSIFMKMVAKRAQSIRAMVITNFDSLVTERGFGIIQLSQALKELIPDFASPLCFTFNRMPDNVNLDIIQSKLGELIEYLSLEEDRQIRSRSMEVFNREGNQFLIINVLNNLKIEDTRKQLMLLKPINPEQFILVTPSQKLREKAEIDMERKLSISVDPIPLVAQGNEEVYELFMKGKLIYTPSKDDNAGRIEMSIADIINPETLEGEFDLSGCGDTGNHLSINAGYLDGRKRWQTRTNNKDKVEIWFVPRFIVEKELNGKAKHLQPIMDKWSSEQAPIGIFWTWWEDDLDQYDYLTTQCPENLSDNNLYEKCRERTGSKGGEGWTSGPPHRYTQAAERFTCSFMVGKSRLLTAFSNNDSNSSTTSTNNHAIIPSPISTPIPAIALGHEETYRLFIGGKLIYIPDPNSDAGKIELPIAALANPLEGTFDLSKCGDTWKYLSIHTGYRKSKQSKNKDKVEIWFVPKFVVEKDLSKTGIFTSSPAKHLLPIMDKWPVETAPIGIFWTWWNDDLKYYDYLTTQTPEILSNNNLYEKWSTGLAGEIRPSGRGVYLPRESSRALENFQVLL